MTTLLLAPVLALDIPPLPSADTTRAVWLADLDPATVKSDTVGFTSSVSLPPSPSQSACQPRRHEDGILLRQRGRKLNSAVRVPYRGATACPRRRQGGRCCVVPGIAGPEPFDVFSSLHSAKKVYVNPWAGPQFGRLPWT